MDEQYHVDRQALLDPSDIEGLRVAVGWDRSANRYGRVLAGSYVHFSVSDQSRLVGFLNVISDGSEDALLLDLMVHPECQRRGLGRALVQQAVRELTADGIRCIQVIFEPRLELFYRKLGFHVMRAGMIDNRAQPG